MRKIISPTFLALILAFGISPRFAMAIQPLDYNGKTSISLKQQIDSFLDKSFDTDLSKFNIASIDLNGDGIEEHFLKAKECKEICTHLIIAEKKAEILLLSNIRARNLVIGSTSSYGVKDVLVFKNNINDYNFDIYMWSPNQKMYILKPE